MECKSESKEKNSAILIFDFSYILHRAPLNVRAKIAEFLSSSTKIKEFIESKILKKLSESEKIEAEFIRKYFIWDTKFEQVVEIPKDEKTQIFMQNYPNLNKQIMQCSNCGEENIIWSRFLDPKIAATLAIEISKIDHQFLIILAGDRGFEGIIENSQKRFNSNTILINRN